jgi:hypothetical protein
MAAGWLTSAFALATDELRRRRPHAPALPLEKLAPTDDLCQLDHLDEPLGDGRGFLFESRPATAQVLARLRVSISSRPAVADVRRQWGMEDLVGLEIELGDAVEYPLAGPE